ncbi:putative bifunctional diguanylate cyclase/phosphodiesterase [Aestuariibacter salexigens]|uniref:putative bifunctional diguanylate cyclase/phosphodiesterase n=1 Tax=Aestuariibacter salexigens TaxID=226010 RepID=UPI000412736B|nr:EAL domain-containing protein [Aestuariibacter salexigens]
MKNSALQTRLILFLVALTLAEVGITLYIVLGDTYTFSTTQLAANSTRNGERIKQQLFSQSDRLLSDVQRDADDFQLRALFAAFRNQSDIASFRSKFDDPQNGYQQNYDLVLASNERGDLFYFSGTTVPPSVQLYTFADNAFTTAQINGEYYLIKAAEVKESRSTFSRSILGWLAYGWKLTNLFNEDYRASIGMDVMLYRPHQDFSEIIASSLGKLGDTELELNTGPELYDLYIEDDHFLYTSTLISNIDDNPFYLALATIEENAYLSFNAMEDRLLLLTTGAAFIGLLLAVIIARSISRPIHMLIDAADRIRQGEYVDTFPSHGTREVAALSGAIGDMQDGIRNREEEIQRLAYFDELTGLPNRNKFKQDLTQQIKDDFHTRKLIIMMDVDRFKEINDTVGHEIGDKLLRLIGSRLSHYFREDAYYARLGGDEFGIIMGLPKGETENDVAKGIVSHFEQPFNLDGLILDVDVSIGVAIYPDHARTLNGLMQCADIALYSCKGQHHHFAVYSPQLNKHSLQRLNLMSELKEALTAGQLSLHYQPKLDLHSKQFSSVECLIRWIHPEYGFMPPDEFIPLAEQTGAIRHVTHWALHVAIHQHVEWRSAGYDISVAVNISAIDLIDLTLPGYVDDLLQRYNVTPEKLMLEVTESAIMSEPEVAIKALNTLHRMGVKLSIDDFGTGYSSLAQLKKMPVAELKIDKAFVLDLANNPDDQVMVNTMLALAKNLELSTVAEGVEDLPSLQILEKAGCDKAQGFYLSKPMPLAQFNQWVDENALQYEARDD